jgi:hypothetical protein
METAFSLWPERQPNPNFMASLDAPGIAGIKTMGYDALYHSPVAAISRSFELFLHEKDDSPLLSADFANKQYGIEGRLEFGGDVKESVAREIHERKQAEISRQTRIAKSFDNNAALYIPGFITAFAASFADPINVASAFVPVVGQTRYARILERMGGSVWKARAAKGAIEGAVGAAMIEPFIYLPAAHDMADYNYVDSAINLGFGAGMGTILSPLGGAANDYWQKVQTDRGMRKLQTEVRAHIENRFSNDEEAQAFVTTIGQVLRDDPVNGPAELLRLLERRRAEIAEEVTGELETAVTHPQYRVEYITTEARAVELQRALLDFLVPDRDVQRQEGLINSQYRNPQPSQGQQPYTTPPDSSEQIDMTFVRTSGNSQRTLFHTADSFQERISEAWDPIIESNFENFLTAVEGVFRVAPELQSLNSGALTDMREFLEILRGLMQSISGTEGDEFLEILPTLHALIDNNRVNMNRLDTVRQHLGAASQDDNQRARVAAFGEFIDELSSISDTPERVSVARLGETGQQPTAPSQENFRIIENPGSATEREITFEDWSQQISLNFFDEIDQTSRYGRSFQVAIRSQLAEWLRREGLDVDTTMSVYNELTEYIQLQWEQDNPRIAGALIDFMTNNNGVISRALIGLREMIDEISAVYPDVTRDGVDVYLTALEQLTAGNYSHGQSAPAPTPPPGPQGQVHSYTLPLAGGNTQTLSPSGFRTYLSDNLPFLGLPENSDEFSELLDGLRMALEDVGIREQTIDDALYVWVEFNNRLLELFRNPESVSSYNEFRRYVGSNRETITDVAEYLSDALDGSEFARNAQLSAVDVRLAEERIRQLTHVVTQTDISQGIGPSPANPTTPRTTAPRTTGIARLEANYFNPWAMVRYLESISTLPPGSRSRQEFFGGLHYMVSALDAYSARAIEQNPQSAETRLRRLAVVINRDGVPMGGATREGEYLSTLGAISRRSMAGERLLLDMAEEMVRNNRGLRGSPVSEHLNDIYRGHSSMGPQELRRWVQEGTRVADRRFLAMERREGRHMDTQEGEIVEDERMTRVRQMLARQDGVPDEAMINREIERRFAPERERITDEFASDPDNFTKLTEEQQLRVIEQEFEDLRTEFPDLSDEQLQNFIRETFNMDDALFTARETAIAEAVECIIEQQI